MKLWIYATFCDDLSISNGTQWAQIHSSPWLLSQFHSTSFAPVTNFVLMLVWQKPSSQSWWFPRWTSTSCLTRYQRRASSPTPILKATWPSWHHRTIWWPSAEPTTGLRRIPWPCYHRDFWPSSTPTIRCCPMQPSHPSAAVRCTRAGLMTVSYASYLAPV